MREAEAAEQEWARADVVKETQDRALLALKRALLEALRIQGVYVLEKGTIDDYYPQGVFGNGKPARAQPFCNLIGTRERAIGLCRCDHRNRNGELTSEFEAIFEDIFR